MQHVTVSFALPSPTDKHHRLTTLRWKKVLQPGLNKGHWTAKEDATVRREVAKAEAEGTVSDVQERQIIPDPKKYPPR